MSTVARSDSMNLDNDSLDFKSIFKSLLSMVISSKESVLKRCAVISAVFRFVEGKILQLSLLIATSASIKFESGSKVACPVMIPDRLPSDSVRSIALRLRFLISAE